MHDSTLPPDSHTHGVAALDPATRLSEAELHFADLVLAVEDHAIFLMDPNGAVMTWNKGAQRIKGYKAEEIIGHSFTRFYPAEVNETGWPQQELERAAADGRFQDESWRVRKDGSLFWANVVITALRDPSGGVRGFLKITRDLTERKQAEELLRQSEERLRLMIESVEDYAIFMLDPEGIVTSWNTGAERINGYTAAEIVGKHFSTLYSTEDVANGKPEYELAVAMRDGRVEDEGWRVRKDRSQFWTNVIITSLYNKQGQLQGFVKITRDMTERRQVEALQFADRRKNEFLAMLAHELRNPLAPIRNGVELLKVSNSSEPLIRETTEMMDRQVMHLVRLVDDLLDVSRIVTGKIHLDRSTIDVNHFIDRAIEEVQPLFDARGHTLVVSRANSPTFVIGDMVRLSQVVSNVLANAAKFTDTPGAVSIAIDRDERDVFVRVRDRGLGISSDELSRVFNLFEQGDATVSRSRGGLGIGLTLVKRIVELHGGAVSAASDGRSLGTEVTIRLPLGDDIARQSDTPGMITPKSPELRRRVLVVDDNVDAALSVERLLTVWGHEVQTAFNGPQAVETALRTRPQFIFLDIGMPGMSGYDVVQRLRSEPGFESVVFTALTGYGQPEDHQRSRDAGFHHHLTKPPDPTALAALLT